VFELEDINSEFAQASRLCDRRQRRDQSGRQGGPESPIFGMPVLELEAGTVMFSKRSLSSGYAASTTRCLPRQYHDAVRRCEEDDQQIVKAL